MPLERELRSAGDCLGRLRELQEQGRVWGQDVILEVKDQELVLSDVESKVTPEQGTPKARYLPARVPPKPGTLHGTPRPSDPTNPGTPRILVPPGQGTPQAWHPPAMEPLNPGAP